MHRVGAGDLAGRYDLRNVEIAVPRRRWADAHALVGKTHMHGIGVGGRVHRDRRDAELLAGPLDAKSDLPPIGDQDLVEHGRPGLALLDDDERLAVLDRLTVLD